jgi:hypothetical protein
VTGLYLRLSRLFSTAFFAAAAWAEPAALAPDLIVRQFCAAMKEQQSVMAGMSMDMDIEASLPKLKKQGRLHALRRISELGRITYEALKFEGDGAVKNNVIARYLTAEAQAQSGDQPNALAVTPDNYKFKYKGSQQLEGRTVHIFQVTPRSKRVGLYKGDLWIDAATNLRVQESGQFVKNPSLFLKRIAFRREYEIRDGVSVPLRISSVVETRLVGKAELNIAYSNISLSAARRTGAADGEDQ